MQFRDQLSAMASSLAGEAKLKSLEPEINVVLTMRGLGQVEAAVEITADHLNQYHRFYVEADQSDLPGLIRSCNAVLSKFPVVGKEHDPSNSG